MKYQLNKQLFLFQCTDEDLVYYPIESFQYEYKNSMKNVLLRKEWRTFHDYCQYLNHFFPDIDQKILYKVWQGSNRSWTTCVDIIRSLSQNKCYNINISIDYISNFDTYSHNWPPLFRIDPLDISLHSSFSTRSNDGSWMLIEEKEEIETSDWEIISLSNEIHHTQQNNTHNTTNSSISSPTPSTPISLSYKDILTNHLSQKPNHTTVSNQKASHPITPSLSWRPVLVVTPVRYQRVNKVYNNITDDEEEREREVIDNYYYHNKQSVVLTRYHKSGFLHLSPARAEKKRERIRMKKK